MKVYKKLNESVNNINLEEGIFSFLGRNLVAKPIKWAGKKVSNRDIRKFSKSDANDYNPVKGGYFTSDTGLDDLNVRIVNSELGKYLEKDPNGKVRFNKAKLNALKSNDEELYNQILTLSKVVAQGNNSSWFRLSKGRRNAIEDALSSLEMSAIRRGILDHPLNNSVRSLVAKHNPDLIRQYNAVLSSYNNLTKNPSRVAGDVDKLTEKRRKDLEKVSARILKLDWLARHGKIKAKKEPELTSATNIAINRAIKNNNPKNQRSIQNFSK